MLLSGALDPVTPPHRAASAARFMAHAQLLSAANAGHGVSQLGCAPRLLRAKGYEVGNIDSTICLERPKVNPHIPEMQRVLAAVMGIAEDYVSIKATTTEKLGFVGRQEGVAAYASVLIVKA